MKAFHVVFQNKNIASYSEFSLSDPKDDEILVRSAYSLISSGTEKAQLAGMPNTPCKFPFIPGYSIVGTIEKVGKKISDFKEGDRVFVPNSGHSNYVVKKASYCVHVPDDVDFKNAVFTRVASFPLLAFRRSQFELGESVVVVGLGMLGLFAVQFAKLAGAKPIIAVGNREIRQNLAKKFGADFVLSPSDPDLVKTVLEITGEKWNGKVRGADVILETSGSEDGLLSALKYTAKHARVMVNGCNRIMSQPINIYQYIHLRGVSLIGAHDHTRHNYNSAKFNWTPKKDYMTILDYMRDGSINGIPLLSRTVSPFCASSVYTELLTDRNFPLGVIFDYSL